jgi:hypothetical protein
VQEGRNIPCRPVSYTPAAKWNGTKEARRKENFRFFVPCFFKWLAFRRDIIPLQNIPLPPLSVRANS